MSPHSISGWSAAVVPTRMNASPPSTASSSRALEVEPPPAPVEQHVSATPPTLPENVRCSR